MAGELVPHTEKPEIARFRYTSIDLGTPESVRAILDEIRQDHNLLSKATPEMRPPTINMSLYFDCDPEQEALPIHAISEFTPIDISNEHQTNTWQENLKTELSAQYPESIDSVMPHDSNSLYIEINADFYVRVATYSELDRCYLDVDLVPQEEFNRFAGKLIDTDLSDSEVDPYQTVKEFIRIWLSAHDIVIQASAYNPPPISLALDLSPQRPSAEQKSSSEPTEASAPEFQIPEAEIVDERLLGFRYIGGLTQAKARLQEIAATFDSTEARLIYGIEPSHFILYGPPGTGKTTLVNALAHEIGATIKEVPVSQIIEKWVGQSGRNLKNVFARAKKIQKPLVLFFDEFEALGSRSGRVTVSERIDVLKLFNTEIEDIAKHHPNIIVAAATNVDMQEIEPSIVRSGRLEPIRTGLPDEAERIEVWSAILAKLVLEQADPSRDEVEIQDNQRFYLYADDINPVELAAKTEDMTGADFEAILGYARRQCFTKYKSTGIHQQVTQQLLLDGIIAIRRR